MYTHVHNLSRHLLLRTFFLKKTLTLKDLLILNNTGDTGAQDGFVFIFLKTFQFLKETKGLQHVVWVYTLGQFYLGEAGDGISSLALFTFFLGAYLKNSICNMFLTIVSSYFSSQTWPLCGLQPQVCKWCPCFHKDAYEDFPLQFLSSFLSL